MNRLQLYRQRLLQPLDRFLDSTTSYRLVLYFLYVLLGWAILAAALGRLPFKWYEIGLSAAWLILICRLSGEVLSRFLKIARNRESDFITALILSLILTPATTPSSYAVLTAAGLAAIASKYILTLHMRHIFNPAATGAFFAGTVLHHYASWWIGTSILTPVVLIGGLLILRKTKRFTMVTVFIAAYLLILSFNLINHQSAGLIGHDIWLALTATPLIFFSTVMLSEPLTSPYRPRAYLPYALLVAVLYGLTQLRISPENALLVGNLAAYLLEPTKRLQLSFLKKQKEAEGIYSFIFKNPDKALRFSPGQYMEWTLPAPKSDSRGNRRYFTISSSPTEKELMLSIRLPSPSSSFKKQLYKLEAGDRILASHLAGSFVLPNKESQKVAFLGGGIGVTPFRSIIKNLIDSGRRYDGVILYSANTADEIAFKDLFDKAAVAGVKTIYTLTDAASTPASWKGRKGIIDSRLVKDEIPDYIQRQFYISGPYGFVRDVRTELLKLGLNPRQITTDYFPGYG